MPGSRALWLGLGVVLAAFLALKPVPTTSGPLVSPARLATAPAPDTAAPMPVPQAGPEVAALRRDLTGYIDGTRLRAAQWGVLVVSLDRGDTLFARNEDLLLTPASNMKVVTTAAALHFLGPSFTYQTFLLGDGPIEEGHLKGDLILYGTGDPGISDRFFRTRTEVFENLADQLAAEGITHIDGAVVGDATYFSGPELGPEWNPRDLNEGFAAPAPSLSFNENIVTLQIIPSTRIGGVPTVETIPSGFPLDMNNGAETVVGRPRPRLWLDRPTPTSLIRIEGEMTQGGAAIWRRLTVPDPALYTARALSKVLTSRGLFVSGSPRAVHQTSHSKVTGRQTWAPALAQGEATRIIARHSSPDMIQYLNVVNHESHNLFAETIFKTMGKVVVGQGSFDGGARAVKSFTAGNVGLDHHDIVAVDGSGLSESNRVSAGGLVEILRYVAQSPQWDAFLSTLPEAGRTLRRMYSTRAARNLRAKTGTIEGVSALTGVVSARNGERLLFSILSNDVASTGAAKRIEDRIGSRLANFQRVLPETPTP